jgi:tetratricopeptide (TPR) repeat protein
LFEGTPDADRWKACHAEFVSRSPSRQGITAFETGHYIFRSNPRLVIDAIVTLYANRAAPSEKSAIFERAMARELKSANDDRRAQVQYSHSENDLNEWGYALIRQKEMRNAIEVFKLNTFLHPNSSNAYDSLAETYLSEGKLALAVENYRRALELNPGNANAKRVLERIDADRKLPR